MQVFDAERIDNLSEKSPEIDTWIRNSWNVLLIGKHGTGKTALVKKTFESRGIKWKYFSGSTMDPWVDIIGVPKEKITEDGISYLELIKPIEFAKDEVEAIFIDELNRTHKKVRNAVMELIQFRSINGRKFHNLKYVWAAINPFDEESNDYDVDRLDPAMMDRFNVIIQLPSNPNKDYFQDKFGAYYTHRAIKWWSELPEETKDIISPRRLDYAMEAFIVGANMFHLLPRSCNVAKLMESLKEVDIVERLNVIAKGTSEDIRSAFDRDVNLLKSCSQILNEDKEMAKKILPHLCTETISGIYHSMGSSVLYNQMCEIVEANPELKKKITGDTYKLQVDGKKFECITGISFKDIRDSINNITIQSSELSKYVFRKGRDIIFDLRRDTGILSDKLTDVTTYTHVTCALSELDVHDDTLDKVRQMAKDTESVNVIDGFHKAISPLLWYYMAASARRRTHKIAPEKIVRALKLLHAFGIKMECVITMNHQLPHAIVTEYNGVCYSLNPIEPITRKSIFNELYAVMTSAVTTLWG